MIRSDGGIRRFTEECGSFSVSVVSTLTLQ